MAKQVIVIGAGMGGLSAAIHVRLRGLEVMVLEARDRAGGKAAGIEIDGYSLDPGPSIIILPRLYEAVFRAAGRKMDEYLRFRPLDPISQVRFEGRDPIDLPAGLDRALQVVSEIAPGDAKAFRDLMERLAEVSPLIDRSIFAHPYEKPFQLADPNLIRTALRFDVRKTYKELVDSMFASPLLRAFFYGFPSYGGQTYDSKAPGALMIPYLMLVEGVFYPEGGVAAIPRSFERLARERGVEFRYGAKVVAAEVEGKNLRAVRLESGERLPADAFIANVDRLTFAPLLGRTCEVSPSLSYFTVHWGLRGRHGGLGHHTLLVPADFERGFEALYRHKRLPERPIVYLNDTSATDPTQKPDLFAVVTAPAEEPHLDWKHLELDYVETIRSEMRTFGIEMGPEKTAWERVQSPRTFRERDGNYRGTLYGPEESQRLWGGLFPLPNRDHELRNLAYCGGSVQPGAGLPMVTLSGCFAARSLS